MGSVFLALIGPLPSIGSPKTLSRRPSVSRPTGIEMGAPVSTTSIPRTSPSVLDMATARTRFSPRCWATSNLHPAYQSVGAGHGDGPHAVLTQVLGHLQREADLRTAGLLILRRLDSQRVIDLRQFSFGEFRIHDRSDHLDDSSLRHCALRYFSASAPPTMSINSLVIAACRALLY